MAHIDINVKGLVKFMTATPSGQRKVLQDYKFPDEREPGAMRGYYAEAKRIIRSYHANDHAPTWLQERGDRLDLEAANTFERRRVERLRNNARAVRQYAAHFAGRKYVVRPDLKLSLDLGQVRIRVRPDLFVTERSTERLIVVAFPATPMDERDARITTQCVFEAARLKIDGLRASSVVICEVASGTEHRGARVGSRMRADIEAACENICALWGGIARPRRAA